jgi:hypothetical protein
VRKYVLMPTRPLSRDEIAELADRLRLMLDTAATENLAVTMAMKNRVQGAVVALDAVLGYNPTVLGSLEE